jgi:RNA polymerase sigma factor (TIGR02999 family)
LANWRKGDHDAPERLFAIVYPELRRIAVRFLHNEHNHHTLEPNALVNALCIRLLGSQPLAYQDRAHFFAIAARTMRRILIDHARARIAEKRGGERERVTLTAVEGWNPVADNRDIVRLDQALSKFKQDASHDPR